MIDYGSCLAFLRSKRVMDKYRIFSTIDNEMERLPCAKIVPPKLGDEVRVKIIELHNGGMRFIDIAAAVKCHQNTVSKYIKRYENAKKAKDSKEGNEKPSDAVCDRHVEGCCGGARCADKVTKGS